MQRAKREQGVACAASRMYPTHCGTNASIFFHEGYALVEIVAAQKKVIEHGRNLFGSP
jgi:hypothetical protein